MSSKLLRPGARRKAGEDPVDTTRKSLTMSNEMWNKVATWRFTKQIKSEAEALRQLIERGLRNL